MSHAHECDAAEVMGRWVWTIVERLQLTENYTTVLDPVVGYVFHLNRRIAETRFGSALPCAIFMDPAKAFDEQALIHMLLRHDVLLAFIQHLDSCRFIRLEKLKASSLRIRVVYNLSAEDILNNSPPIKHLRTILRPPLMTSPDRTMPFTTPGFKRLTVDIESVIPAIQKDVLSSLLRFLLALSRKEDHLVDYTRNWQVFVNLHKVLQNVRREETDFVGRLVSQPPTEFLPVLLDCATHAHAKWEKPNLLRSDKKTGIVILLVTHVAMISVFDSLMQTVFPNMRHHRSQQTVLTFNIFQNYPEIFMHEQSQHFSWYRPSQGTTDALSQIFCIDNEGYKHFTDVLRASAHWLPVDCEYDFISAVYDTCVFQAKLSSALGQPSTPKSVVKLAFSALKIDPEGPNLSDVLNLSDFVVEPHPLPSSSESDCVLSFLDPVAGTGAFVSFYLKTIVQRLQQTQVWNDYKMLCAAMNSLCKNVWSFERDFLKYEVLIYNFFFCVAPMLLRLDELLQEMTMDLSTDRRDVSSLLNYQMPRVRIHNIDVLTDIQLICAQASPSEPMQMLSRMNFNYCAGNPPFIRRLRNDATQCQTQSLSSFVSSNRALAEIVEKSQVYCRSLAFCAEFLDELGGEMAMITPYGWLNNVNDKFFRQYLLDKDHLSIPLVVFFPARLVYPDDQSECLLVQMSKKLQPTRETRCAQPVESTEPTLGATDDHMETQQSTVGRAKKSTKQTRFSSREVQGCHRAPSRRESTLHQLSEYVASIRHLLEGEPVAGFHSVVLSLEDPQDFDRLVHKGLFAMPNPSIDQALKNLMENCAGKSLRDMVKIIKLGPQSGNDRILRLTREEQHLLSPGNERQIQPYLTTSDVHSHLATESSEFMVVARDERSVRKGTPLEAYLRLAHEAITQSPELRRVKSLLQAESSTDRHPHSQDFIALRTMLLPFIRTKLQQRNEKDEVSSSTKTASKAPKCKTPNARQWEVPHAGSARNECVLFKSRPNTTDYAAGALVIKENNRERSGSSKLLRVGYTTEAMLVFSKKVIYALPHTADDAYYILAYLNSVPFALYSRLYVLRRQESGLFVVKTPMFSKVRIPEAPEPLRGAVIRECRRLVGLRKELELLGRSHFRETLLDFDGVVDRSPGADEADAGRAATGGSRAFYSLVTLRDLGRLVQPLRDASTFPRVLLHAANLLVACWLSTHQLDRLFCQILRLSEPMQDFLWSSLQVPTSRTHGGIQTSPIDFARLASPTSDLQSEREVSQILLGMQRGFFGADASSMDSDEPKHSGRDWNLTDEFDSDSDDGEEEGDDDGDDDGGDDDDDGDGNSTCLAPD